MVMSENAIVEAMMVAARIHFSCARERGARASADSGIGMLFMAAPRYVAARCGDSETPSFEVAFREWAGHGCARLRIAGSKAVVAAQGPSQSIAEVHDEE